MKKLCRRLSPLALVAALLLATVAAMPAALPTPDRPTATPTANGGELRVSWTAVLGASFYTVGWANLEEYEQIHAEGRNWLDSFHFVTLEAGRTGHTLSGLKPMGKYYVIVGARAERFGSTDITWSEWTDLVTTAGQHGAGICPITGVTIPEGGYQELGDTVRIEQGQGAYIQVTVESTDVPATAQSHTTSPALPAPTGYRWFEICGTVVNNGRGPTPFLPGQQNNVATEQGIGFGYETGWYEGGYTIEVGDTRSACDTWKIPAEATTVVYAVSTQSQEWLYLLDVPSTSN